MSELNVALKPKTENLLGRRFFMLLVVGFAGYKRNPYWVCRCDCGTEKEVEAGNLKRGNAKSCGCMKKMCRVERAVESVPGFRSYIAMLSRCNNVNHPGWSRYGGRGITVCEKWSMGFWHFYEDVGPRPSRSHTLDRIDVEGNYEPGNVRWATAKEQQRNRRKTWTAEIDGVTRPVAEWAEIYGLDYRLVKNRIRALGWTTIQALTTPIGSGSEKCRPKHPRPR